MIQPADLPASPAEDLPQTLAADRRAPQRRCLITRQTLAKDALMRFVVSPDNHLVFDIAEKLPGRGYWLTASQSVVAQSLAKSFWRKITRIPVQVAEDLPQQIAVSLEARALQSVMLARKAGQAVHGFDKIDHAAQRGQVEWLLHANDAGADGVAKLAKYGVPACQYFTRDQLSQIFAVENAVHVALLSGTAGEYAIKQIERFTGFINETSL